MYDLKTCLAGEFVLMENFYPHVFLIAVDTNKKINPL